MLSQLLYKLLRTLSLENVIFKEKYIFFGRLAFYCSLPFVGKHVKDIKQPMFVTALT